MFCVHNQCVELRVIKHLISAQCKTSAISCFISTVARIIEKQIRSRSLITLVFQLLYCGIDHCGMWCKLHAQMVIQPNGACNEHLLMYFVSVNTSYAVAHADEQ